MPRTDATPKVLIVHPPFANALAVGEMAQALLGIDPYEVEDNPLGVLIPDSVLPHLTAGPERFGYRTLGKPCFDFNEEEIPERFPVAGVLLDEFIWMPLVLLEAYTHVIFLLRSPFSLLKARTDYVSSPTYAEIKNAPTQRVDDAYVAAIWPKLMENWNRFVGVAVCLNQTIGTPLMFAEALHDNPEQGARELVRILDVDDPERLDTAQRALEANFARHALSGSSIDNPGWTDILGSSLCRSMRQSLVPAETFLGNGYLDLDVVSRSPRTNHVDPGDFFTMLDPVDDQRTMERLTWLVFRGLAHLPGKSVIHIPARAGSSRMRDKNLAEIGGIPLLGHTVLQARTIKGVDRVLIDTDSREYADLAGRYGAESLYLRPEKLATNTASLKHVQNAVLWRLACEGYPVERFAEMYPTAPFRHVEKLNRMHAALQSHKVVKSVTTYSFEDDRLYEIEPDGLGGMFRRETKGFYKITGHFNGFNCRLLDKVMPDYMFLHNSLEERVDIDTIEDFQLLERLYELSGSLTRTDSSGRQNQPGACGKLGLKLLYISEGNLPSRAANAIQASKMAQAFHRTVSDCTVLTVGDWYSKLEGNATDFKRWHGLTEDVHFEGLPMSWKVPIPFPANLRYTEYPQAALAYARREAPDLVFTRSMEVALKGADQGLPVILEIHESDFAKICGEPAFAKDNFIGVVTISEVLKTLYVSNGLPRKKCFASHLGVDVHRYENLPGRDEARRVTGLDDRPVILYSGHFSPEKGTPVLFEAASRLPEYHFVLVGGWPDDLNDTRAKYKINDLENLTFTGFVPNSSLPLYLASATVCVLPFDPAYERAGWVSPLKLFEYMAVGRPILAADIASFRRYLSHGTSALMYTPCDAADLARKIVRLVEDKELSRNLSGESRRLSARYSWDNRVRDILGYFEKSIRAYVGKPRVSASYDSELFAEVVELGGATVNI